MIARRASTRIDFDENRPLFYVFVVFNVYANNVTGNPGADRIKMGVDLSIVRGFVA